MTVSVLLTEVRDANMKGYSGLCTLSQSDMFKYQPVRKRLQIINIIITTIQVLFRYATDYYHVVL